jgi:cell division protein FtsZ
MKTSTKIKVVGVGGSGLNAVSRMFTVKIEGVDLIAINADVQDLKKARADLKLQIGKKTTGGLGAGMNPKIGEEAAKESKAEIREILKGTDMVFITCGLGGGVGTGAAPIIAEVSKKEGALTVAVVTKPFSFEGIPRKKIAEKGLENLKNKVDTLLVIPNDRILKMVAPETSVFSAFWHCDDILRQAVQGISDLITLPGIINVDFADLESVMKNSGPALLGVGKASGEKRIEKALNLAVRSPLLGDTSFKKGRAVLFNISGGKDLALTEVNEAAQIIKNSVRPEAKVIFGSLHDKNLAAGEVKIMVIITGV